MSRYQLVDRTMWSHFLPRVKSDPNSNENQISKQASDVRQGARPRYTKYVRKGHEYARTYVAGQYRHLGKFDSKGSWDKFNQILEAWKEGAFDNRPVDRSAKDPTLGPFHGAVKTHKTLIKSGSKDPHSRGDHITSRPDLHAAHVSGNTTLPLVGKPGPGEIRFSSEGGVDQIDGCLDRHSEHVDSVSNQNLEIGIPITNILVCELVAQYVDYALEYYGDHGKRRSTVNNLKPTLRSLLENYGETFAEDFGPRSLKALRETWIERGHSRTYCNDQSGVIKRVWQFAVEEEMVSGECYQALRAVRNLKRGRTRAHETPPVLPIDDSVVDATTEAAHAILKAMIRLQRLTGMRPSEVCQIRPCDIDRGLTRKSPDLGFFTTNVKDHNGCNVWWFTPESHKTEHHGKQRIIAIGPRGQDVIMPYLLRDAADYCFRPSDISPQGKLQYTTDGYRQAIWRACDRAGVERWSPNRLRHTAATEVRKECGIESAQVTLGHARADVTQVYAERDMRLAEEVAQKLG